MFDNQALLNLKLKIKWKEILLSNTFFSDPYKGLDLVTRWPNFTDATGLPGAGPGLVRSVAEPL